MDVMYVCVRLRMAVYDERCADRYIRLNTMAILVFLVSWMGFMAFGCDYGEHRSMV